MSGASRWLDAWIVANQPHTATMANRAHIRFTRAPPEFGTACSTDAAEVRMSAQGEADGNAGRAIDEQHAVGQDGIHAIARHRVGFAHEVEGIGGAREDGGPLGP